jgi:hypothetical protein
MPERKAHAKAIRETRQKKEDGGKNEGRPRDEEED